MILITQLFKKTTPTPQKTSKKLLKKNYNFFQYFLILKKRNLKKCKFINKNQQRMKKSTNLKIETKLRPIPTSNNF